jgi:two-component system, OmpR family, sensor histidine kinase CreC
MLLLARVEQLQAPEGDQTLDPKALLDTCLSLRQQALTGRQLQTRITVTHTAPIRGDALLLQQALLNLIDNAIDFSPTGSTIELGIDATDDAVSFHIRDHGPGTPDYALPQIFDRFYSLPRPATGKKSTGLGLALVREVARLHGGDAGFENHPEGGGIASIRLPSA